MCCFHCDSIDAQAIQLRYALDLSNGGDALLVCYTGALALLCDTYSSLVLKSPYCTPKIRISNKVKTFDFQSQTSFLPSNFPVICVLVGYERKGFLPGQHFRYTVDARNEIIIVVFFKSNASWNAYDWLPSGETMSITRRRWCNIDCTTESNCFQSKVLCSFDGFKMWRFVLPGNAQKREHIGTSRVTWKGFRLADFECLGLCPKENEWNG